MLLAVMALAAVQLAKRLTRMRQGIGEQL